MVFGWGKKKHGPEQQDPAGISEHKIPLLEIDSILLKQKESKKKWIVAQASPRFLEIQNELNSIYEIITHLQNDTLNVDDIEKVLKVLVLRSKSDVIEVISKESKKPLPAVSSYDDVVKTADLASHTLKKIGDVLGKHSRVIHVFAKKYAQDLKDHLESITKNHATILKMISDFSLLESTSNEIKEKITKITMLTQEATQNTSHIKKLQESCVQCDALFNSTQQHILNMNASSEHAKFMEYSERLQQTKIQEQALNKEIDDEFSKISRPLGKYVYVTSLDKIHKSILEKLVERPSHMIDANNKNAIVTILESCMKGIISGAVSVKEADKSVDYITRLMSLIDGFILEKNNTASQIQALEENLTVFDSKKLDSLQKQLYKLKSDKIDLELKIKNITSDHEQKITQKNNLIKELEIALEKLDGVKYKIEVI